MHSVTIETVNPRACASEGCIEATSTVSLPGASPEGLEPDLLDTTLPVDFPGLIESDEVVDDAPVEPVGAKPRVGHGMVC